MYYLYIDESGDHDDYRENFLGNPITSKFFTLGGIIVDEKSKKEFHDHHEKIKTEYFKGIKLGNNFKLHYHEARQVEYPYNLLSDQKRFSLIDEMFNKIVLTDCTLLSVTIDKQYHCNHYDDPVNARAYSLRVILERYQYYLEECCQIGEVIFERYNSKMSKRVERVHRWLKTHKNFPNPTNFGNVNLKVKNGNPELEPILQYADFFRLRSIYSKDAQSKFQI